MCLYEYEFLQKNPSHKSVQQCSTTYCTSAAVTVECTSQVTNEICTLYFDIICMDSQGRIQGSFQDFQKLVRSPLASICLYQSYNVYASL